MGKREERLKLIRLEEYLEIIKEAETYSKKERDRKLNNIKLLRKKIKDMERKLKE